ncbi:uncharacterized protein MONBRDRAFT_7043 [Monosiga brevicollis MX1]|uniref:C2H2-type domain-containing protein n=1 Tax=Monosiga brevicollis TaxID=81824 RepID=A9UVQ9_MONBE|nr:uncharacterized protein MONBRDRAFT_7043 [Monosiga brevicollis MX1]EDQ90629.1 predicted protein [Monosiga brevicollis MX1]|eukprot:XP_001744680.1 hypothetical protein [Monosiga brevicollis MX1]
MATSGSGGGVGAGSNGGYVGDPNLMTAELDHMMASYTQQMPTYPATMNGHGVTSHGLSAADMSGLDMGMGLNVGMNLGGAMSSASSYPSSILGVNGLATSLADTPSAFPMSFATGMSSASSHPSLAGMAMGSEAAPVYAPKEASFASHQPHMSAYSAPNALHHLLHQQEHTTQDPRAEQGHHQLTTHQQLLPRDHSMLHALHGTPLQHAQSLEHQLQRHHAPHVSMHAALLGQAVSQAPHHPTTSMSMASDDPPGWPSMLMGASSTSLSSAAAAGPLTSLASANMNPFTDDLGTHPYALGGSVASLANADETHLSNPNSVLSPTSGEQELQPQTSAAATAKADWGIPPNSIHDPQRRVSQETLEAAVNVLKGAGAASEDGVCPVCSRLFTRRHNIRRHISRAHPAAYAQLEAYERELEEKEALQPQLQNENSNAADQDKSVVMQTPGIATTATSTPPTSTTRPTRTSHELTRRKSQTVDGNVAAAGTSKSSRNAASNLAAKRSASDSRTDGRSRRKTASNSLESPAPSPAPVAESGTPASDSTRDSTTTARPLKRSRRMDETQLGTIADMFKFVLRPTHTLTVALRSWGACCPLSITFLRFIKLRRAEAEARQSSAENELTSVRTQTARLRRLKAQLRALDYTLSSHASAGTEPDEAEVKAMQSKLESMPM